MVAPTWTETDTANACQAWQDYQAQHDIASLAGKTAGIDPSTRKIRFGDSAADIVEEMEREGLSIPLYFVRVGFDHYLRKGAPLITGVVDSEGVPSIEIEIDGRSWHAVIDTGFNGDLELPAELRAALRAKFIGRIRSLLAGGQTVDEDNFLVRFPFDGIDMRVEATFVAQSEILVGTHLLRNHKLEIDFRERTVRLERSK